MKPLQSYRAWRFKSRIARQQLYVEQLREAYRAHPFDDYWLRLEKARTKLDELQRRASK